MERTAGTLHIISAPSGAGKTSLVKALLESTVGLAVSVSHTTRPMRPGEENGRDYHFVDAEVFQAMIDDGAFLEHARVFDHLYGTSRGAVMDLLNAGEDVVLEIDWQGARQVRKMVTDCVSTFVLPPSRAALETRLRSRGQDSEAVIERRMRDAVAEMAHYQEFDYLVFNDDFDTALMELRAVVLAQRQRLEVQKTRHGSTIRGLLA